MKTKGCVIYSIISTLVLLSALSACMPWGTDKQAVEARKQISVAEVFIDQTLQEFTTLLQNLTVHEGVKMLAEHLYLVTTPAFPVQPPTYVMISPYFGEFQETASGVFERAQTDTSAQMRVTYLDGRRVVANNFEFLGGQNNEITSFGFYSSDGGVQVYYHRINGLVQGVYGNGKLNYTRPDGVLTDYDISYQKGARELDPCLSLYGVPQHFFSYCDSTNGLALETVRGRYVEIQENIAPGSFVTRSQSDTILFRTLSQTGIWVAKQTLKKVTQEKSDFPLNNVEYSASMQVTDSEVFINNATNFSYRANGSARINGFTGIPYQVAAAPIRGPYHCDVSDPLLVVGSGESLTWRWVDGLIETLFPVEGLSCADLVWQP